MLKVHKVFPTMEIFAFSTDLKNGVNYPEKEFARLKSIDNMWDSHPIIRSICILDKGWWIFWKSKWHYHKPDNNKKETISYLSNTLNTLSKLEISRGNPRIGEYLTNIEDLILIENLLTNRN